MQKLHASSSFSALANVPFRQLWIASLASGTAVAADQTAARWMLNHLSGSAFVISLLSTMAALPFLVFTLPAGLLADAVDRRPLLQAINMWQALVAGTLALLGFLGVLTPAVLLGGSLAFGLGFAFTSPVWTALLPDVVSERDLPSTATLGALQMNLSGIVGPALGGFLLSLSSPPFVFGLNGLGFLWVVAALRADHAKSPRKPRPETGHLRRSLADAFLYVRASAAVRAVLARNFLFALFVSANPNGRCGRRRLDSVCLRALVSRPTGDCPLGERPRKCRRHHAVAGRDGCGRDRLGSRGRMVWHADVFTGNRRIIRGLANRRPPLVD